MDNNTNKKPTKTNMPKFNLNWLYMIIAMMLLGLYLTNESGTASKNIPYDEFQEYVRNGYISKVTGYDDNSVEAYVKPQYVPNVFKADSSRVGKNPLITTEAPSRESLGDFLQKKKTKHASTALSATKRSVIISVQSSGRYYRLHSLSVSGYSSPAAGVVAAAWAAAVAFSVSANPKHSYSRKTLR